MGSTEDSVPFEYEIKRETAPEQYFLKSIKDLGSGVWKTNPSKSESVIFEKLTDLKLMCSDGVIHCHQAILASHSFFIRSMLLRNHVLEFGSNIDWKEASAYLCDRRKPDYEATIIINDFDCDTISRMLSCFYTGNITFNTKKTGIKLKEAWDTFLIDSVQLGDLQWLSKPQEKDEQKSDKMDITSPKTKMKTGNKRSRSPTENENNSPNKQRVITINDGSSNSDGVTSKDIQLDPTSSESSASVKEFVQNKWASITKTPQKSIEDLNSKPVVTVDNRDDTEDEILNATSDFPMKSTQIHTCEICHHNIVMPKNNTRKENFIEFQKHLLIHTSKAMFGEIPFLDKYYCPNPSHEFLPTSPNESDVSQKLEKKCNSLFDDRESFLIHLSNDHEEFYFRINRRLRETGESVDETGPNNVKLKEEYNHLKAIKRALQNKVVQEKFEYSIPKASLGHYICTEADVLSAYEKEHRLSNPDQFLHCNNCSEVFKNAENCLQHLFLEHYGTLSERLNGIAEQEEELSLKNAVEMLSWKNEGTFSTRISYCCPFSSCSIECSSKSAFIRHLSYSHHLLRWIIMLRPETLIRNFTSSKFYKDFVALNPNLSQLEAPADQHANISSQYLTPKKHFSPRTPKNNEVLVEAVRSSPVTPSQRTPGKRNQNRRIQNTLTMSLSNENQNSDTELFQCMVCSKTVPSYNAKLKKIWMVQHLTSTMHRNKPTLISCVRCKQEILCQSPNDLEGHSCSLSNLLYQSIHSDNTSRTGRHEMNNYSNLRGHTNDMVNECEVIDNVSNSEIQNID